MSRNSILISAIDPAFQKTYEKHITCPEVRFVKDVMFSGTYGSLEVTKRSFGGHRVT